MTVATARLVEISSPPLGPATRPSAGLPEQLADLLMLRNGFFAFESALHVFHSGGDGRLSIESWNADDGWREAFGALAKEHLFFAQDIFGEQFSLTQEGVMRWSPESGESEPFAPTIEAWAQMLLDDFEYHSGYPVAHDWQALHGPLAFGHRLFAKTPFVLGGEYEIENLVAIEVERGMRHRAALAHEIAHRPDGTKVRYELLE